MLEIKDLYAYYENKCVLEDINLCFERGRFYAVVGRNSSGKSTLMNCIMSIKKYDGSILLDSKDTALLSPRKRAEKISLLAQKVTETSFSVRELCGFGRSFTGESREITQMKVREALEKVGIVHLSDRSVNELSGGERQLSYFAMNVCQDAEIMILDEPSSNLDVGHEAHILSCAKKLCTEGKTVICVIHDLSNAVRYADSVVVMDGGRCVFSGSRKECLDRQIIESTFKVRRFDCGGEIFFAI